MIKLTLFLLILFITSCVDVKKQKKADDPLYARFILVESKLTDFANRHNADISTAWIKSYRYDPNDTDTYAIKRIVWSDSLFGKGIIIQPHSDIKGIDSLAWDFTNIAWLQDELPGEKPTYVKNILTKVNFEIIERNIDQLLSASEKNLREIRIDDLR